MQFDPTASFTNSFAHEVRQEKLRDEYKRKLEKKSRIPAKTDCEEVKRETSDDETDSDEASNDDNIPGIRLNLDQNVS